MKYGSVCSGIEAATVAWHTLGWQPVWFSEIDSFPSNVLQHHYPQVPNLGNMTKLSEHKIYNNEPIDLLVGGTPCQSFSIAGLRGGLDDQRGNLALEYCRILIKKQPRWFVWENVPGVFSSNNGADFANILSAFTGQEVKPQGIGNAGIIQGKFYSVAWRVLDAQYFGVPQRRRRVFVVGYIGNNWRAPYAVLFERQSLCRDFEVSAKARQETAREVRGSINPASWWDGEDKSGTLTKNNATGDQRMPDKNNFGGILQACNKDANGFNFEMYSGQYERVSPTLQSNRCKDTLVYPFCIQGAMIGRKIGPNGNGVNENVAFTLNATDKHVITNSIIYDTTQITSPTNKSNPQPNICHSLNKGCHPPLLVNRQTTVVRRLTPLECERLQGLPDNYTNIPGAKDDPRYAAIGNSMAVPVMHWIGQRINTLHKILNNLNL